MLSDLSGGDPADERVIKEELAYLLHIRRKGVEYSRKMESSLDKALQDILNDFHNYEMNLKVLVVLIETGYIQTIFDLRDKSIYPKFLITVLKESHRVFVKESCCRMIIKLFGKNEI